MDLRRIVAAACVLSLAWLPGSARAFNSTCHEAAATHGKKDCVFNFNKTPIQIRAETTGTNVSVHLQVRLSGYPEMPPLVECSDSGSSSSTHIVECSAAFPDSTTAIDTTPHPLLQPLVLACHFEGSGSWEYSCDAG